MTRNRSVIDRDTLAKLWAEGMRAADIADQFGITEHAVRTAASRYMLPSRRAPARREWKSHMCQPGSKMRKCLHCGGEFPSEWIGNRVCTSCKSRVEFSGGALI